MAARAVLASLVAASAPAWLGLGGVVVGGVLGYVSSAVQEAVRRRHELVQATQRDEREDKVRFENRRFDAYVTVITAANNVYAAAKFPVVERAEITDRGTVPIIDPAFQMSQLNTSYDQFRSALSPAFLLATSAETRDCLAALASATSLLRKAAIDAAGPAPVDLQPLFREHRRTVKAAEAAMRVEFGMVQLAPYMKLDHADDPGHPADPAPARSPEA